ncbi:MAG: hypothetical protein V9F01_02880 [Chitinophagaceae bacterium]
MRFLSVFSLCVIILSSISCNKDIAADTPGCIRREINSHGKNWETGSVDEYFFQNRLVYAFAPDGNIIADGSTVIKDENCNQLCTVGGFGGPQVNQCNGENFFQTAVFKRNIWKKK